MANNLARELLTFLHLNADGTTDEKVLEHFGVRYKDLVPVINELLQSNRLQLFTQGDYGATVYRAIKEETANKLDGLG
jgi:hypothetical protein